MAYGYCDPEFNTINNVIPNDHTSILIKSLSGALVNVPIHVSGAIYAGVPRFSITVDVHTSDFVAINADRDSPKSVNLAINGFVDHYTLNSDSEQLS